MDEKRLREFVERINETVVELPSGERRHVGELGGRIEGGWCQAREDGAHEHGEFWENTIGGIESVTRVVEPRRRRRR